MNTLLICASDIPTLLLTSVQQFIEDLYGSPEFFPLNAKQRIFIHDALYDSSSPVVVCSFDNLATALADFQIADIYAISHVDVEALEKMKPILDKYHQVIKAVNQS